MSSPHRPGIEERKRGPERTICGTVEIARANAQSKRQNSTEPRSWLVRKLMVGTTAALMAYAGYVYIGRLCVPLITRKRTGGRGAGVALLTIFSLLYLWMIWAYLKVILTSPGFAKDYIPKSERPLHASAPMVPHESWHSTAFSYQQPDGDPADLPQELDKTQRVNGLAGPSYENILLREGLRQSQDSNAGVLDAVPKPHMSTKAANSSHTALTPLRRAPTRKDQGTEEGSSTTFITPSSSREEGKGKSQSKLGLPLKHQPNSPLADASTPAPSSPPKALSNRSRKRVVKDVEREQRLETLNVRRKPPTTPILLPAYRYCSIEGLVKPYRSHHCRVCGTCVLKYDHHCPWIGQCVGARNHKFFYNFCQATSILTAYVFATLLTYTLQIMNSSDVVQLDGLDAQEIVIIALAGLFFLFTLVLVTSHTRLILIGQSTVEGMQIHNMRDREDRTLQRGFSWWEIAAKQRKRKEWDQEWGRLDTEGNIWWRGSPYTEWVSVMGRNKLGWIFPIGRSEGDGLDYPVNPRFDADGRWRRRAEWPPELR